MQWVMVFPFLMPVVIVGAVIAGQASQKRKRMEYWSSLSPLRERLPASPSCPRCRGSMERGYLLDRTHGAFGMGTWLEGAPNVSSTAGLVHRPQMERSLPVVTFRCTGCGYLESFARPDLIDDSNGDGSKKPAMFGEL